MKKIMLPPHVTQEDIQELISGRHANPFSILGVHKTKGKSWLVAFVPDAVTLSAKFGRRSVDISRLHGPVFAGPVPNSKFHHVLAATYADGQTWTFDDPYRFGPVLGDLDVHLLGEGTHRKLWKALGAHVTEVDGVAGTHFAVWAPNAARVSVVGDFNVWDGCRHPMRRVGATGVWEIFLPGLGDGTLYK